MFKLTAPLKDYLWGGTLLKSDYNKKTKLEKVAESWELSCHKDGASTIEQGEFSLMNFTNYAYRHKKEMGTNCDKFSEFPILIKLIDACDNLSVQVHPNNEYAQRVEKEYGKTEMWYIVDCQPGATLLYGLTKEISKEEFKERIENSTLLEVCNKVHVKKGDVFFIEAGTLHAIGAGIVIAEIQQNSNTTYRIYDYDRVGVDGNPRELHIDKAVDVTDLTVAKPHPPGEIENCDGYNKRLLSQCEYFTVNEINVETKATFNADEKSFHSLLCLEGSVDVKLAREPEVLVRTNQKATLEIPVVDNNITETTLIKGESLFIPAHSGEYTITGTAKIILTTV